MEANRKGYFFAATTKDYFIFWGDIKERCGMLEEITGLSRLLEKNGFGTVKLISKRVNDHT
ncbi:hypothetical protein [Desulfosporosinus lacus]|uniref:hypothetical protein n=1 Tax=Desulfosporosinus lacus TaxID=329936 RepID=UPI000933AEB0|nr:hypothetical protein [Desulfosporosinus lacus]